MTKEERNNKLKYLITCMKCEVSGKCCENCPAQYEAGNMGEIIKNLEEISKILEQEPCTDAISRSETIEYLNTNMAWYDEDGEMADSDEKLKVIADLINGVPSVTPAPKKCHNENLDYAECDQFVCSNCGIELQD